MINLYYTSTHILYEELSLLSCGEVPSYSNFQSSVYIPSVNLCNHVCFVLWLTCAHYVELTLTIWWPIIVQCYLQLNLASQSVLEGLNACFDHRAEVFVPELCKTFHIQHEKVKIFACQNPLKQGGGRKGLPQSFLNRFTQVLYLIIQIT